MEALLRPLVLHWPIVDVFVEMTLPYKIRTQRKVVVDMNLPYRQRGH